MLLRLSQRKAVQRLSGIGKPLPPALVAILRVHGGDYQSNGSSNPYWYAPRTSKYSFYCYGSATSGGPGNFTKKTAIVAANTEFRYWIARGIVGGNQGGGYGGNEPTILKGGGIDISIPWGGAPTGGDTNSPDGSLFAPSPGTVGHSSGVKYGQHPGGGQWTTNNGSGYPTASAYGEIRIVDETPG